MKKILILFSLLLLWMSCSKFFNAPEISIGVQSGFQADSLLIFLNGKEVAREKFTTIQQLSLSRQVGVFSTQNGDQNIKVFKNQTDTLSETFNIDRDIFLGINFDYDLQKLVVIKSSSGLLYD